MFPELHHLLGQPKEDSRPKHQVRAEDVFPASFPDSCKPRVLVFPSVSGRSTSTITPLDKDEALHELAPNVLHYLRPGRVGSNGHNGRRGVDT